MINASPRTSSVLDPGSRIGDFQIIAPLKSGGMATLFLGRKVGPAGFARPVAIKVVHAHLAVDQSFVEMFLDEARLSASIRHPNVVHVEALGETQGIYYLVMEYVHGCTLQQFVQKLGRQGRKLAPELAAYIAMKVADGLHAAHETKNDRGEPLGVVHRDVSPQNILLGYDGHVKLIDFGVAKAKGRSNETSGGSLKGKIRYMPPEQAWGREVDRRADVYALGIVLWECLTFRRLFDGDNDFQILEAVRNPVLKRPSQHAQGVAEGLDDAVMTSLSPSVEERFQTAQAMRRAIGGACPKALQVEPDDLAALLAVVMEEDIQKTRKTLPREMSSILSPPQNDTHDSSIVPLEEFTRIGDVSPDFTQGDVEVRDSLPSSSRIVPSQQSAEQTGQAGHAQAGAQGRTWLWAAAVTLGLTFGGIAIAISISMRPVAPTAAAPAAPISPLPVAATALPTPSAAPSAAPSAGPTTERESASLARGVNMPEPDPAEPAESAHRSDRRRDAPSVAVTADPNAADDSTTTMRGRASRASVAQPTSATTMTTTTMSAAGPIIDTVEF